MPEATTAKPPTVRPTLPVFQALLDLHLYAAYIAHMRRVYCSLERRTVEYSVSG
jgi:hypothetical protein